MLLVIPKEAKEKALRLVPCAISLGEVGFYRYLFYTRFLPFTNFPFSFSFYFSFFFFFFFTFESPYLEVERAVTALLFILTQRNLSSTIQTNHNSQIVPRKISTEPIIFHSNYKYTPLGEEVDFIASPKHSIRLGVLGSTKGADIQAMMDALKEQSLSASISVVVSNRKKAEILKRADDIGIRAEHVDAKTHKTPEEFDRACDEVFTQEQVDYILLIGYMRRLSPWFLNKWNRRVLNVSPSIVRDFSGEDLSSLSVRNIVLSLLCHIHQSLDLLSLFYFLIYYYYYYYYLRPLSIFTLFSTPNTRHLQPSSPTHPIDTRKGYSFRRKGIWLHDSLCRRRIPVWKSVFAEDVPCP